MRSSPRSRHQAARPPGRAPGRCQPRPSRPGCTVSLTAPRRGAARTRSAGTDHRPEGRQDSRVGRMGWRWEGRSPVRGEAGCTTCTAPRTPPREVLEDVPDARPAGGRRREPQWFAGQAAKAAADGEHHAPRRTWRRWSRPLEVLATFEPAAVLDGRALLHKSFMDMYPNLHISPRRAPRARLLPAALPVQRPRRRERGRLDGEHPAVHPHPRARRTTSAATSPPATPPPPRGTTGRTTRTRRTPTAASTTPRRRRTWRWRRCGRCTTTSPATFGGMCPMAPS